MKTFKIKKVGKSFFAFNRKTGGLMGTININTSKFVGDTKCLVALKKRLVNHRLEQEDAKQKLIDAVIEQIKEDVASGDLTAVDELLTFVPEKNLKGYLPEDLTKHLVD